MLSCKPSYTLKGCKHVYNLSVPWKDRHPLIQVSGQPLDLEHLLLSIPIGAHISVHSIPQCTSLIFRKPEWTASFGIAPYHTRANWRPASSSQTFRHLDILQQKRIHLCLTKLVKGLGFHSNAVQNHFPC